MKLEIFAFKFKRIVSFLRILTRLRSECSLDDDDDGEFVDDDTDEMFDGVDNDYV